MCNILMNKRKSSDSTPSLSPRYITQTHTCRHIQRHRHKHIQGYRHKYIQGHRHKHITSPSALPSCRPGVSHTYTHIQTVTTTRTFMNSTPGCCPDASRTRTHIHRHRHGYKSTHSQTATMLSCRPGASHMDRDTDRGTETDRDKHVYYQHSCHVALVHHT